MTAKQPTPPPIGNGPATKPVSPAVPKGGEDDRTDARDEMWFQALDRLNAEQKSTSLAVECLSKTPISESSVRVVFESLEKPSTNADVLRVWLKNICLSHERLRAELAEATETIECYEGMKESFTIRMRSDCRKK